MATAHAAQLIRARGHTVHALCSNREDYATRDSVVAASGIRALCLLLKDKRCVCLGARLVLVCACLEVVPVCSLQSRCHGTLPRR